MPGEFVLRYLPVAQKDLTSIFDYIAQDSPSRALRFVDKLDHTVARLERHPFLGRIPRHQRLRDYGYRVLIIESYLVFYIVRDRKIEVHRIVHYSRNLDHLI